MNSLPDRGVEDMTKLDYLHEAALLANLRRRFAAEQARLERMPVDRSRPPTTGTGHGRPLLSRAVRARPALTRLA